MRRVRPARKCARLLGSLGSVVCFGRGLAAVEGAESGWGFAGDRAIEGMAYGRAETGLAGERDRLGLFHARGRRRSDLSFGEQGDRR